MNLDDSGTFKARCYSTVKHQMPERAGFARASLPRAGFVQSVDERVQFLLVDAWYACFTSLSECCRDCDLIAMVLILLDHSQGQAR